MHRKYNLTFLCTLNGLVAEICCTNETWLIDWLTVSSAVQVNVLDMETVGDWAKFSVSVVSVYKSRGEPLKRGDNILWVHMKDLACKCPKIQMSKRFLVMGGAEGGTAPAASPGVGSGGGVSGPDRVGLVADKNSLVIQWRDVWTRRLRKFQRKEKKGKCSKAWSDLPDLSMTVPRSLNPHRLFLIKGTLRIQKQLHVPSMFYGPMFLCTLYDYSTCLCVRLVCLKKGPIKWVWNVQPVELRPQTSASDRLPPRCCRTLRTPGRKVASSALFQGRNFTVLTTSWVGLISATAWPTYRTVRWPTRSESSRSDWQTAPKKLFVPKGTKGSLSRDVSPSCTTTAAAPHVGSFYLQLCDAVADDSFNFSLEFSAKPYLDLRSVYLAEWPCLCMWGCASSPLVPPTHPDSRLCCFWGQKMKWHGQMAGISKQYKFPEMFLLYG